jgi:hypothetical protein
MLGVVESTTDKLLIGQSNSGLVDPLQMTAMGVASITACLLLSKPNVDRAVAASVLMRLSDDVGPTAIRIEKETFERAQGVVTCSPICPRL